jgi:energy-coupling factor transporter ATP-binding protein EcfA2
LIPAKWKKEEAKAQSKVPPKILEGEFNNNSLKLYNREGYNIYFFPNDSKTNNSKDGWFSGEDIDNFKWVFIDIDLKDKVYASITEAVDKIKSFELPANVINITGNGVHAFWRLEDLDAFNYVTLQQKLIIHFKSDPSIYTVLQLMRVPGYYNTKDQYNPKLVETIQQDMTKRYKVSDFGFLPELDALHKSLVETHLTPAAERVKRIELASTELPSRFTELLNRSEQVKDLFLCKFGEDRSSSLWRLCHMLVKMNYEREEILRVAINTDKGKEKGADWVQKYIMDDLFTHDIRGQKVNFQWRTLEEVKTKAATTVNSTVFKIPTTQLCPFDYGYRPGDVLGLIGGSGAGKSTVCLNIIREVAEANPDFVHVYISLEMSEEEIYDKVRKQVGATETILPKIIIISNENDDGTYRNLSLQDINDSLTQIKNVTGKAIGVVVLDNINIMDKGLRSKGGRESYENANLMQICKDIKEVARTQEVFWITQSQSSREKAGEGDLPLYQDAAYGTSKFENFCTFVITLWQPLKNQYGAIAQDDTISNRNLRVIALRYCKNRFQSVNDKALVGEIGLLKYDLVTDRFSKMDERDMIIYHKYEVLAKDINKKKKSERDMNIASFTIPTAAGKEESAKYDTIHKLRAEVFSDNNIEVTAKPTNQ